MELMILVFPLSTPPLEELAGVLVGFDEVKLSRSVLDQLPDGIVVEGNDDYARIEDWWAGTRIIEILSELEENWPPTLLPLPAEVGVLGLQYHRWASLPKQIVIALATRYGFLIDTNNNAIYTSNAFLSRCRLEPDWTLDPPLDEILLLGRMSKSEKEEWRKQHPRPRYPTFYETWPPAS
jgi:hypothetical protein